MIGTKAVTQTLGHLLKLACFCALVAAPGSLTTPPWTVPLVVACAVAGTRCGRSLLARCDDARFRLASRALILASAVVYVSRGLLTGS